MDAFIAQVDAAGAKALLGFAPGKFGLTVIESEYAEMIKLHLIREKRQELDAQEQAIMAKWMARR